MRRGEAARRRWRSKVARRGVTRRRRRRGGGGEARRQAKARRRGRGEARGKRRGEARRGEEAEEARRRRGEEARRRGGEEARRLRRGEGGEEAKRGGVRSRKIGGKGEEVKRRGGCGEAKEARRRGGEARRGEEAATPATTTACACNERRDASRHSRAHSSTKAASADKGRARELDPVGGFDPAGVGSGGVQVDHRARGRLGALSPSEQLSDGWALTLLIVRRAARTAILRLGRSMRSTMGVASSESSLGEAISDPTRGAGIGLSDGFDIFAKLQKREIAGDRPDAF